VDAVVDAIKVVTDALPDSGALTSLSSTLATIDGVVDAIKAVTDNLPDSGALTSVSSAIATVDAVMDAIKLVTDALPDSGALTSLAQDSDLSSALTTLVSMIAGVVIGQAATGTLTTTSATTNLSGYASDSLIGRTIVSTGGAAQGNAGKITDYDTTGGLVTWTPAWTAAPANGDAFKIV